MNEECSPGMTCILLLPVTMWSVLQLFKGGGYSGGSCMVLSLFVYLGTLDGCSGTFAGKHVHLDSCANIITTTSEWFQLLHTDCTMVSRHAWGFTVYRTFSCLTSFDSHWVWCLFSDRSMFGGVTTSKLAAWGRGVTLVFHASCPHLESRDSSSSFFSRVWWMRWTRGLESCARIQWLQALRIPSITTIIILEIREMCPPQGHIDTWVCDDFGGGTLQSH